jgi:hypothetical protein
MRIDIPGPGGHWAEMRDVGDLRAADEDAWMAAINDAYLQRELDDDQGDVSANGATEPAPRRRLQVNAGTIRRRYDDLLAALITDWSYAAPDAEPHIPLPYTGEARKLLPLAAGKTLDEAMKPHQEALNADAGPKEPPAPASSTDSGGSRNGSADESQSGLPGFLTEEPATASG